MNAPRSTTVFYSVSNRFDSRLEHKLSWIYLLFPSHSRHVPISWMYLLFPNHSRHVPISWIYLLFPSHSRHVPISWIYLLFPSHSRRVTMLQYYRILPRIFSIQLFTNFSFIFFMYKPQILVLYLINLKGLILHHF